MIVDERLYSNGLLTDFANPLDVVRNTVGIQAQAQRMAEINIALRCPSASLADLEQLYSQQKIVRSWANRWTLHLLTYEDWELLINARPEEQLPSNYFLGQKELALAVIERLSEALRQRKALDREEINQLIRKEFPKFDLKSYLIFAVFHELAHRGLVYMNAASPQQKPRFIYAEKLQHMTAEAAIEKLIPRYLTGFAPASLEDFVKWSGIKIGLARKVWNQLELPPREFPTTIDTAAGKTLIAARFDSLLTGYQDKSWLTPPEHTHEMWTSNGILNAPIIHDNKLVGKWTYKISGKRILFETKSWGNYDPEQLEAKFNRIAKFLDKDYCSSKIAS